MRKAVWVAPLACVGALAAGPLARAQDHSGHMLLVPGDAAVRWQPGAERLLEELGSAGVPSALVSSSPASPATAAS